MTTEVQRERGFVVKNESARGEFAALVEKLGHGASREHIAMSREDALGLSDQDLLAQGLHPATFRAMIEAREQMTGAVEADDAESIWQRSNAKLIETRAGGNHGHL